MSFKRVGDDPSALRVQKKQRVSELLLEDIPEDEAKLLKNGRFACVVCRHCPVFDTVAVLSIHRQGKKHLANAKVRLEKLREDAELRQKREHMKYMETLTDDSNKEDAPLLRITQQQTERALQGSTEFKNQCVEKERKPNNLPFFQSKKPINLSDTKTGDANRTESSTTVTQSEEAKPIQPFFQSKKPFNSNLKDTKPNNAQRTVTDSNKILSNSEGSTKIASQSHPNPGSINELVKLTGNLPSGSSNQWKELSPTEKARREHFSRLRQAGWIMGLDGKWYKDENAEFDSDEDEPPPPP